MAVNQAQLWRLNWNIVVPGGEFATFHFTIQGTLAAQGVCSETERSFTAVHAAMVAFWDNMNAASEWGQSYLGETTIQGWQAAGATAWGQCSSEVYGSTEHASNVNSMPLQCSTVVSLMTNEAVPGPRQRRYNRAYLGPMSLLSVGANGQLTDPHRDIILLQIQQLHSDLQATAAGPPGIDTTGLLVWSPTNGEAYAGVTASIGLVYDTQRRRRNRLDENYEGALLPDS